MNDWRKEGIDYWDNKDCPREVLEQAYIELVEFIEGVEIHCDDVKKMSEQKLRNEVGFYEYLAEK